MRKISGSVLLVDDDPLILEIISKQLKSFGLFVINTTNGIEALSLIKNNKFNLIITDLTMPEMSGAQFVEKLTDSDPKLPIIVITGKTIIDDSSLFSGNVLHFLSKPFSEEDLYSAVSESGL